MGFRGPDIQLLLLSFCVSFRVRQDYCKANEDFIVRYLRIFGRDWLVVGGCLVCYKLHLLLYSVEREREREKES
jgi:hypothetical protein